MKYIIFLFLMFSFVCNQNSSIYFSINGIINSDYKEPEKIVGLSCSIYENSKLIKSDTVNNIKTELFEGTGQLTYATLKNSKLNLFKRNPSLLVFHRKKINTTNAINLVWKKSPNLSNKIVHFLLNDKCILYKQGYVFHKIDTTLSDEKLIEYINERYDMTSAKIEDMGLLIIDGTDRKRVSSFTSIILNNNIYFIEHSKFEQIIEINSNYYLLLMEFVPSTGIISYTIYTVINGKLEKVFHDGSLST